MQNPKIIGIFAGIGFVLSLLIGLFSGVKASQLFLRAFMSALFSGLLAWGLSFLLLKVFENVEELEAQQGDESQKEVLGNYINVSLGDDSLEEEDNAPHFFVSSKQMESKAPSLETFSSPKADLKDGDTFTKDEPEIQQGKQAQVKKVVLKKIADLFPKRLKRKIPFNHEVWLKKLYMLLKKKILQKKLSLLQKSLMIYQLFL